MQHEMAGGIEEKMVIGFQLFSY